MQKRNTNTCHLLRNQSFCFFIIIINISQHHSVFNCHFIAQNSLIPKNILANMKFLPAILAASAPLLVASAAIPADTIISKHQKAVLGHISDLTNTVTAAVKVEQVGLIISTVTNSQVVKVIAGTASATKSIDHIVGPVEVVVKPVFKGALLDIFTKKVDKPEENVSKDALLGWLHELAGLVPEGVEPDNVSLVFAPLEYSLVEYLQSGPAGGAAGKALEVVGGAAAHITATVVEVKEVRLDGVSL